MIFYSQETSIALAVASLPAVTSIFLFFNTEKKNAALILLMLSALLLRLVMISLDPFLHEWDEHFHALVAKNMMTHPFIPMLFAHPIVQHDVTDWSYSHIWLHKQPLFLWQMAVSMKLFGVNEIAVRLPSAIMSTISVWLTYAIAEIWVKDKKIAFTAALLSCFSFYSLELVSGSLSLEHNDIAFIFYITLSIWCLLKYFERGNQLKWAIGVGVAVGCAVLNKWLTGYLVFGGWGIYVLATGGKNIRLQHISHLLLALVVSVIVFLPWQLYITNAFPLESAQGYKSNVEHILTALGHPGSWSYHFQLFPIAYHLYLLPFFISGLMIVLMAKQINRKISFALIAMVVVLYAFFSFIVKTKMPTFTFAVSAIIFVLIATGIIYALTSLSEKINLSVKKTNFSYGILVISMACLALKPFEIINTRSQENTQRNKRIHNTHVIKEMNDSIPARYTVLNFRKYENIDYMFYTNGTGYHFYPDSVALDTIMWKGRKMAALDYSDQQKLPGYIRSNPAILILDEKFE